MFEWLKDKTIGRMRRWFLRQYLRVIGDIYQERLRQIEKDVPEELKEYHELEILMNNNVTVLHNLYKEANDRNRFQEAFLYFFYEFEINLKHMIMSEMMKVNIFEALKKRRENFFSVYSRENINSVQKIGYISELITKFCSIYGEEIKTDLESINRKRNFIIHNMLKEKMSEAQIKDSFRMFFVETKPHIKKAYGFFIRTFDDRPQNFLRVFKKFVDERNEG